MSWLVLVCGGLLIAAVGCLIITTLSIQGELKEAKEQLEQVRKANDEWEKRWSQR